MQALTAPPPAGAASSEIGGELLASQHRHRRPGRRGWPWWQLQTRAGKVQHRLGGLTVLVSFGAQGTAGMPLVTMRW